MRKRLFDGLDQGLGEEIILLDGLAPPEAGETTCEMTWALRRCLALLGQDVPGWRLMGLTGAAFMLPFQDPMSADWNAAGCDRRLLDVLADLGWQAHRKDLLSPAVALGVCREALREQRPVLAHGEGAGWAAVVGLKGEELLAQVPDSDRPFERLSAQSRSLIIFQAPVEPAAPATADRQALQRALPLLEDGSSRWLAWAEALAHAEPYGAEPARLERFLGEQFLVACVADARDGAARFLADVADQADFELAEAWAEAAGAAEAVVTLLEQLIVPPDAVQWAHVPEDEAWLDRRRELLHTLHDADDTLRRAIAAACALAGELD